MMVAVAARDRMASQTTHNSTTHNAHRTAVRYHSAKNATGASADDCSRRRAASVSRCNGNAKCQRRSREESYDSICHYGSFH
jgi:hypothetical protein